MKRLVTLGTIRCLLIVSLTLATWLNGQERTVAFVDVTVVPMDKEQTLPHQTVVVVGGRITQVASAASVKVSPGALKIDGKGKFLMPGLADMHVHFIRPAAAGQFQPSASNDYAHENQALALLFVANGITTVRNMWGHPAVNDFAKEVDAGHILGPHIYSTGPVTDGNPSFWESARVVETREQAEEAVRSDKQAGYIAVKVIDHLSKDAYQALVASARQQGLPVVGHVPTAVGLSGAIAARQDSIEHLTGFWEALQPDGSGALKKSPRELVQQADLKKLPALVQATKAADVWNCPTLAVGNHIIRTDAVWFQELSLVPPGIVERYKKAYTLNPDDPRFSPEARALNNAIVKAQARLQCRVDSCTIKVTTAQSRSQAKFCMLSVLSPVHLYLNRHPKSSAPSLCTAALALPEVIRIRRCSYENCASTANDVDGGLWRPTPTLEYLAQKILGRL